MNQGIDGTEESKKGSLHALEALNFFVADVQNGMGPYVALFLKASLNWNAGQIGLVMAIGNLAGVAAQTPAGALIDHVRSKRAVIVLGCGMISAACLAMVAFQTMPVIAVSEGLIGVAGAIFPPALAALALGLAGRARLDRQIGKNQAINSAGNVFAAIVLGLIGYLIAREGMFYVIPILSIGAVACLLRIRTQDVDYRLSRGGDIENNTNNQADTVDVTADGQPPDTLETVVAGLAQLGKDSRIRIFLLCAVLFHFSNAALVPLVTEILSSGKNAENATLYTTGFMVGSQLVFVGVGALAGKLAGSWGRKPLFLIAFAALILRAVLFTLGTAPYFLIAVQALDGLGAGIFGVVSVLIIADLTKGTGRFNAAQGAVATAVGTGAFLSNILAGELVKYAGYDTGFLSLAAIGVVGLAVFWRLMPETLVDRRA